MKRYILLSFVSFFALTFNLFSDFWKELNKVLDVIEAIAAPTISNLTIAESVENGVPVNPGTAFPKNVRKLHVWFNIFGAGSGTTISVAWYQRRNKEFVKISELTKNPMAGQNQNWMDFSLSVPEGSLWPVGVYKVEVIYAGKVLASREFEVRDFIRGGEGIWSGETVIPSPNPSYPITPQPVNQGTNTKDTPPPKAPAKQEEQVDFSF